MLCYLNLFDTLRSLSCLVSGSKILSDALRVVSKNKDTSWGTYHTVTNGGPDSCSRHSVTTPRHESSPSLHRACRRRSNAACRQGKSAASKSVASSSRTIKPWLLISPQTPLCLSALSAPYMCSKFKIIVIVKVGHRNRLVFTFAVSSATKAGACAAQVEAEAQETFANRITQSHF